MEFNNELFGRACDGLNSYLPDGSVLVICVVPPDLDGDFKPQARVAGMEDTTSEVKEAAASLIGQVHDDLLKYTASALVSQPDVSDPSEKAVHLTPMELCQIIQDLETANELAEPEYEGQEWEVENRETIVEKLNSHITESDMSAWHDRYNSDLDE